MWKSSVRFDVWAWIDQRSRDLMCDNCRTVALVAIAGLTLVLLGLVALDPNALCLLPVLALAVPLLLRRYPGERLIAGLRATRRSRWPRPRLSVPRGTRRFVVAARGGLLLARALAVRPPPASATAS